MLMQDLFVIKQLKIRNCRRLVKRDMVLSRNPRTHTQVSVVLRKPRDVVLVYSRPVCLTFSLALLSLFLLWL